MHPVFQRIGQLLQSYVLIVFIALFAGLVFADTFKSVAPYGQVLLAIICFLSALKLDLKSIQSSLKDMKMMLVVNTLMLILFPVIIFYLTKLIAPQYAVAFMILAAMPTAMTAPLLSEVCGGRQELALVLTATTSLIAPFTIPLAINLFAHADVHVNFWSMASQLALVMILPIVMAMIIRPMLIKSIQQSQYVFKPISLALLGLLIAGIVGKQAEAMMKALQGGEFIWSLVALCILFVVFHIIGYFATPWRDKRDRITISVCLTYMNFTLAIFLVGQYFTDPNIIIPVILSTIPWSLMVIPFRAVAARVLDIK